VMKPLRNLLWCVALLLHGSLAAQQLPTTESSKRGSKPLLFSNLPDSFEVDKQQLQQLFAAEKNDTVHLQLSSHFVASGQLVEKNHHTPGSVSVNVRVSNYANALFNVTLRLLADNSTQIQGRIIHPKFGDALLLYKENDKYFIKKQSTSLLLPD